MQDSAEIERLLTRYIEAAGKYNGVVVIKKLPSSLAGDLANQDTLCNVDVRLPNPKSPQELEEYKLAGFKRCCDGCTKMLGPIETTEYEATCARCQSKYDICTECLDNNGSDNGGNTFTKDLCPKNWVFGCTMLSTLPAREI